MQDFLEIGQIVNTYGIKGFLKVVPFTDDITRFDNLNSIYIVKKDEKIEMTIEQVKYHKNLVLLKLKGIDDINQAEVYKGCFLKIKRKDAVKLPKDSYFIVDLIGLEVYTLENRLLGKVDDIFKTGSNDVYVVKDSLGKQILLPAIKEVIKTIDIENKKIVVDLIEGLE